MVPKYSVPVLPVAPPRINGRPHFLVLHGVVALLTVSAGFSRMNPSDALAGWVHSRSEPTVAPPNSAEETHYRAFYWVPEHPSSYTHRPTFSGWDAPTRPGAGKVFPTNSFVWEKIEIDSRPPNTSGGLHGALKAAAGGRYVHLASPNPSSAPSVTVAAAAAPCSQATYPESTRLTRK